MSVRTDENLIHRKDAKDAKNSIHINDSIALRPLRHCGRVKTADLNAGRQGAIKQKDDYSFQYCSVVM